MIRVFDLDRSIKFYDQVLGLEESYRLDFPEFALVYLRNAETQFEVELTLNKGRTEPYTHGDGYGHIAIIVDDACAERERIVSLGYTPGDVKEFKDNNELIARFFFITDPDGYKIEILEKWGHYV
jgi:lactoylglutathione lyase